jgi:hypothetical protein
MPARKPIPPPEEVLAAVVALADDGFCRRRDLALRFAGLGERDLRRAVRRAVALGLVLERRGPDGSFHLAASSEGWSLLRGDLGAPVAGGLRRSADG